MISNMPMMIGTAGVNIKTQTIIKNTMIIGSLVFELEIPHATSLKDKRQVIKSLQTRLRNQFNISVAEVDKQNQWQYAVIAVVCVASSQKYAHGLLTKVATWVEESRLDCVLGHYEMEFF